MNVHSHYDQLQPLKQGSIVEISGKLKNRQPSKELRDQAHRDAIINAARKCVVRRGFHAASMAEIAGTARMSVGQIYRYFPNKEAIIHAIVERIVEERLKWISSSAELLHGSLPVIGRRLFLGHEDENREDRILMLEASAEATRNPVVAEIVREADRVLRREAVAMLRKGFPRLSEQQANARVELFATLAEGSAMRRFTRVEGNEQTVVDLFGDILVHVFKDDQGSQRR